MEEGIVYVSEDRAKYGLVIDMSIKHNISLPQLKKLSRMLFINREKESDVASQFMSDFAIKAPNAEFIVANLSGGNQQKVSVSKALALKPKLLILDEPTRGVDVNAKAEIHKIISMLSLKGLSILMISSELPELLGMCDRIYVMKDGEMKGCFLRSDATQENILTLALGVNGNVSQGVC
jgi:ABC-type sugar transport system ATPase subunit